MNTTERKIHLIEEAKYYADFNLVGEHIIKAKKAKPKNKTVIDMYNCWQNIGFFVHSLITKAEHIEHIISEYRADKLRAITRARKAEQEVQSLQKEIDKYKTLYE